MVRPFFSIFWTWGAMQDHIQFPNLDFQELFTEPVLETEFLNPGYAGHSTDVWRVRTTRKTCIVRISTPKPLPGPFWAGCELLFGRGRIDPVATRAWLDFLRTAKSFRTPRVYSSGQYTNLNYLVVENMPGQKLDTIADLTESGLEEFGRSLANLHFNLFAFTGGLPTQPGEPPEAFHIRLASTLRTLVERFFSDQEDLARPMEEMCAFALNLPPNPFGVPVMPDIDPTQFLASEGRITALVDVDACAIGPRELDLVALEYVMSEKEAPAFRRGYEEVLPIPYLGAVRPVYRYLYRLMEIQQRLPLDEWLARPALF
jgi:hypothetical protein